MSGLFDGQRTALSKQVILEQVFDVAEHLYKDGVEVDPDNADWFVVPNYFLPRTWKGIARYTPLLVVFPTAYPEIPPVGFYLRATIAQSPSGHFYDRAYHDASKEPLEKGWRWYCCYVNPGSWAPAPVRRKGDWARGDNLWTYMRLVKEVLTSME